MHFQNYSLKGLFLLEPRIFHDERGYFFESYNKSLFQELGIEQEFVQDNQSFSKKGTLRGLHFQSPPFDQGKLVRVIRGSVLDVAVDIRKDSPTFGKHACVELSGDNQLMFWVPPGFAHGFISLEDDTIFCYKCTNPYSKISEGGFRFDDPDLNISWGDFDYLVSDKDRDLPLLKDINSPF